MTRVPFYSFLIACLLNYNQSIMRDIVASQSGCEVIYHFKKWILVASLF